MFSELKPHESYRGSGTPWLPRLPSHWASPRLKTVLTEKNVRGFPDEPLLAATQSRGVIRKADYGSRTVTAQKDLDLLKLVEVGDFVISLRSFQGGIERAHARGIISPAYTVLESREPADADYLTLLFKSRPFVDALTLTVTGIREGQNIEYPRLARDPVPLPSRDEQAAIVKYLAHAHRRIDRAIAAKRRLSGLIDEQHQALTRRLLTSTSDGDSTGWRRVSAGRLCKISTGVEDSGNADPEGEYPFFVRGREILRARGFLMDTEAVMTPGDGQGGVGKVFHYFNGKFQAHQRVYIFSDFDGVDGRFFYWYLSTHFRRFALSQSNTVTMESLRLPVLSSFPIELPSLSEQRDIVNRIEAEAVRADAARSAVLREIGLLREFRTRLTSDVVTGQVDVRHISATLPDLAPDEVTADVGGMDDDLVDEAAELLEDVDA
ncbi:restriction endonuclease subunit S [Cellulomonas citrea]|uniref:restriction endonuclease subunit S n=1 Tax=Cellulomonas citrea TaxID=1909423 RepID=UPI00135C40B7|nr:restriction endonuclease subunit S [Cellulomonas citrea]